MNIKDLWVKVREFWLAIEEGIRKEIIDQAAHFAVAFVSTMAITIIFKSELLAVGAVLSIAIGREIAQRLARNDVWYGCEAGCRLDIIFWLLGILSGVLVTNHL